MPAVQETVAISGLRELQQAFREANSALSKELPAALRRAGEPVRIDAELLAVTSISHIGLRWSRMRVGVRPGLVYVAPKQKGATRGVSRRRRPNLAPLLMEKAMKPALARNLPEVQRIADDVLEQVERAWKIG